MTLDIICFHLSYFEHKHLPRSMIDVDELAARGLVGHVQEHASYHVIVRLGEIKVVPGATYRSGGGRAGGWKARGGGEQHSGET